MSANRLSWILVFKWLLVDTQFQKERQRETYIFLYKLSSVENGSWLDWFVNNSRHGMTCHRSLQCRCGVTLNAWLHVTGFYCQIKQFCSVDVKGSDQRGYWKTLFTRNTGCRSCKIKQMAAMSHKSFTWDLCGLMATKAQTQLNSRVVVCVYVVWAREKKIWIYTSWNDLYMVIKNTSTRI